MIMMSSSFPKSSISQSASQRLSLLPLPYVIPQVRVPAFLPIRMSKAVSPTTMASSGWIPNLWSVLFTGSGSGFPLFTSSAPRI